MPENRSKIHFKDTTRLYLLYLSILLKPAGQVICFPTSLVDLSLSLILSPFLVNERPWKWHTCTFGSGAVHHFITPSDAAPGPFLKIWESKSISNDSELILYTVLIGYSDTLWNLNFSRTVAGITEWFWVTIEGYLSYLLPKFEDLVPTSLGSGAI